MAARATLATEPPDACTRCCCCCCCCWGASRGVMAASTARGVALTTHSGHSSDTARVVGRRCGRACTHAGGLRGQEAGPEAR